MKLPLLGKLLSSVWPINFQYHSQHISGIAHYALYKSIYLLT